MKSLLTAALFIIAIKSFSQPYVDPFHLRYTHAFKGNSGGATPFNHLIIAPDLPIKLKHNALFVVSPVYEKWDIDSASQKSYLPQVSSTALALSGVIPLDKNHWLLTVSAIPRINSEALNTDNSFQFGGVLLATYKNQETLKYKFGVYVNREFFGIFVMPLGGIDWRINSNNNLFGILPGRLTFEHKLNTHFYTGATFRAITSSYRLSNGNYLRIEDNQLSGFLDCYLTKHVVVTGEAGYGIMRELRAGKAFNKNYLRDFNWSDGSFVRLSASYRIRL
jgi:hypothetical protein